MIASQLPALLLAATVAAEHRVAIGPGVAYSPSMLVVHTGDVVHFAASQAHPLRSDDGLFDCFEDCSVGFDTIGSFGFHCETHGVPGAAMAGTVHVVGAQGWLPPSPALDGLWYDPAVSGQGMTIETVEATGQMLVGWFTWRPESAGTHDWLTGAGQVLEDRAEMALRRSSGGRFLADDPVASQDAGAATLRFFDCSTASLQFDRDDIHRSGVITLRRLAPPRAECDVAALQQQRLAPRP